MKSELLSESFYLLASLISVCSSVLQCGAVCCGVCCSVLQCVATSKFAIAPLHHECVLQCVAVCVAVRCSGPNRLDRRESETG